MSTSRNNIGKNRSIETRVLSVTRVNAADLAASRTTFTDEVVFAPGCVVIGGGGGSLDPILQSIADLSPLAADRILVSNGGDGWTTPQVSSDGVTLIGQADIAAMVTYLGLTIGTDTQAYSASLTSMDSLAPFTAGDLVYATAAETFAKTTSAAFGRSLLTATSDSNARTILDVVGRAPTSTATAIALHDGSNNLLDTGILVDGSNNLTMPGSANLVMGTGLLGGISQAERTQLANIDTAVISTANWSYVPSLNQNLGTGDSPTFSSVTATSTVGGDPGTNLATKDYVDLVSTGSTPLVSVSFATDDFLPNTPDYDSPAQTLTSTAGAGTALVVDGVTLVVGDNGKRVLVKNQLDDRENGIYIVTDYGGGVSEWQLTRASDFNQAATPIVSSSSTFVELGGGGTNDGTTWSLQTTVTTIDPLTDSVMFIQTGGVATYTASNGITLVGLDFRIDSPLDVAFGGTGVDEHTVNGVLVGNGAAAVTSGKAAPTGDFVGTTDTQPLSNKTLTTPFIDVVTGSTSASGDLILRSTTNATKGQVVFDETTQATSITTGAVHTDGGLSVTKNIYSGGNIVAIGNIEGTWAGTTLTVSQGGTGNTSFDLNEVLVGGGGGNPVTASKLAPTGAFVGTTDTQILTDKTLTEPIIDIVTGSTVGGGDLTLRSTTNATKGDILVENTNAMRFSDGTNEVINLVTVGGSFPFLKITDPSPGNGTHFTDGFVVGGADMVLKTNSNFDVDGNSALLWQNEGSSYTFSIRRQNNGSTRAGLVFSSGQGADKTTLTDVAQFFNPTDGGVKGLELLYNLASTNTTSGSLVVVGGAAVSGDLNVGGTISGTWGGDTIPVSEGGTGVTTLTPGGVLVGNDTSPVTSGKAAPLGEFVGTTDTQIMSNKTLTAPKINIVTGATTASGNLVLRSTTNATKGQVVFDETTEATSITTGAVHTDGGMSVTKNLHVGGDIVGTWNGDTIPVSQGGTGNTSFDLNEVLVGGGSGNPVTASKPAPSGAFVGTTDSQELTNKTFVDNSFVIRDNADATKTVDFQLTGLGSGQNVTLRVPAILTTNTTIVGNDAVQTLTNKTLTTPIIDIVTGGTGASDDLVLRSTTNGTKGQVVFDETTEATSITTGAVHTDGGMSVTKNLYVGGDIVSSGSIAQTTYNATSTSGDQYQIQGFPYLYRVGNTAAVPDILAVGPTNILNTTTATTTTVVGRGSGNSTMSGFNCTILGRDCGIALTTGSSNTFIGAATGATVANGFNNIIIGRGADVDANNNSNTTIVGTGSIGGSSSTVIGSNSISAGNCVVVGRNNTSVGANNIIIGIGSGLDESSATFNTLVGIGIGGSLQGNTNFINNVFMGYQAAGGAGVAGPQDTVGIGYQCMFNISGGDRHTFTGSSSGYSISNGFDNTGYGYRAGYSVTSGEDNCYFGSLAGENATGDRVIAIGYNSCQITAGNDAISIGANTSGGGESVFLGNNCGGTSEQSDSVIMGYDACGNSTSSFSLLENVIIGWGAAINLGASGSPTSTNCSGNVVVGYDCGSNGNYDQCVLLGSGCAPNLNLGGNNIMFGHGCERGGSNSVQSGVISTIADVGGNLYQKYMIMHDDASNSRIGVWFDVDNQNVPPSITPTVNRFIEVELSSNDSANAVATALASALNSDSKFTASATNDRVSYSCSTNGYKLFPDTGDSGMAIISVIGGTSSSVDVTVKGANNIVIGSEATAGNYDNCIVLGSAGIAESHNEFVIAENIQQWRSAGMQQVGTGNALEIDTSTGVIGYTASSQRYKSDVQDIEFDTSKIFDLHAVSFTRDKTGKREWGLIAEEVHETIPEIVTSNRQGQIEAVRYIDLMIPTVVELKKTNTRIDSLPTYEDLQQTNTRLASEIAAREVETAELRLELAAIKKHLGIE